MSVPHKQKVEELFEAALDCDAAERSAFLAAASQNHPSAVVEVRALLKACEKARADSFMQSPAFELHARQIADENKRETLVGQIIGRYRIIERIGSGGMGAVYKAIRDDNEYKTEVAIKLIKRGMDTDYILSRFRSERQILANLNHPNIARLLDGGTTKDGLPYFVMEYIEGQTLNEYCHEQNLSTKERLELFRTVCSAVQYAHQNLIIHRDIKPSNIIVTEEGIPKLLDFGIAKILHQDSDAVTALTAAELRVLTPEYASPEQVMGDAVNVSGDVYSLGVVLYELLTGRRPYSFKSRRPDEVAKVICEQEPNRPSTAVGSGNIALENKDAAGKEIISENKAAVPEGSREKLQHVLRGDLDNIILMALRKEPERRYATVEQFSEDIRRHLKGLPVTASKDTWSYRASKFMQRNRFRVMSAGLILLVLIGGMAATLYQASIARQERLKAERRFNDVRQLANSVLFEVNDEIQESPTRAREKLVQRALHYLDTLTQEGGDPNLERELAAAYERVGDIQGNAFYSNLGDAEGALASYRKSLALREKLQLAAPNDLELRVEIAQTHERIGDVSWDLSELKTAMENYERAYSLYQELSSTQNNAKNQRNVARIDWKIGDLLGNSGYANLGDLKGGLERHQKAINLRKQIYEANPDDIDVADELYDSYSHIGNMQIYSGDVQSAIETYQNNLALAERLYAAAPTKIRQRESIMEAHYNLGEAYAEMEDYNRSLNHLRQSVKYAQELSDQDKTDTLHLRSLTSAYNRLGKVLARSGDINGAMENFNKSLTIREKLANESPTSQLAQRDLMTVYIFMGSAWNEANNAGQAIQNFRRALEIYEKLDAKSSNPRNMKDLSSIYAGMGEAMLKTNDIKNAMEHLEKAVKLQRELLDKDQTNYALKQDFTAANSLLETIYQKHVVRSR